jgi:WD40 repeat protein
VTVLPQVWSLEPPGLLHSLRGHTGPVTGLRLLPGHRAVSGSQDCSLRLWDLAAGQLLSSTYTYNPVTRLVAVPGLAGPAALTGTAGGKLEVFQLEPPASLVSRRLHEDAVTALALREDAPQGPLVASGCRDGAVRLDRLVEGGQGLVCLFVLETSPNPRPVCCVQIGGEEGRAGHVCIPSDKAGVT